MQGTLRTTGALVAKCLEDTVKNLGLLVICILPVGFTVLYQAVLGGAEDARHVMSWFVFPTMLTFATTMAPPTIALYTTALDREKDDMKHAIGGLLDGMPNDVDIAAVNAPSPVDGINGFAKEHGCDLIVMGSRGLGVLRGMLGSVSNGVLRSAEIPVLVAKKDEDGK